MRQRFHRLITARVRYAPFAMGTALVFCILAAAFLLAGNG